MASGLDVLIRFTADSRQAVNAAKDVDDAYSKTAKSVTKAGVALTAGVTVPLVAAGVAFTHELESAGKVAAQTNAVIQSTGGVANVSAEQVSHLATAISEKSGMDDEAVASGENLLLTFTNVRNEAGKGNDVFNQATNLAADLSVAWGIDMTSAATKVGKALQDPIAGVSALQKVGVSFNETQKEQIRSLVESGDVMGAQKIILKELATEVGGSAAAYGDTLAGQVDKARETLLNAGASVVSVFAPAIKLGAEAVKGLADFLGGLPAPVQQAIGAFALVVAAAGPVLTIIGNIGRIASAVHTGIEAMVTAFTSLQIVAAAANVSLLEIAGTMAVGILAAAAFVAAVVAIGYGLKAIGEAVFGAEESFSGMFEALDKGKRAGKEWADTIIAGAMASANPVAELQARLQTLRFSMDAAAAAAAAGKLTDEQRAETYGKLSTAIGMTKDALEQAQAAAINAAAQDAARKEALDRVAESTRGLTGATNEQIAAVMGLSNAVLAAEGGALAYEAAQLGVESAQKRVDDLIASGSVPTSLEYRQAQNQLEQAHLAAAGAAMKMSADNQTLANTLLSDGVPGLLAMRATLVQTIATHGDATGAIQGQINKIDGLVAATQQYDGSHATATFHAETRQANETIAEFERRADAAVRDRTAFVAVIVSGAVGPNGEMLSMMAGGTVPGPPGSPHLAIIHGGEVVVPYSQVRGMSMAGGTGAMVGGNNYSIAVNVAPGTSPAQVGAATVDAIRAYERVAGRAWRETS